MLTWNLMKQTSSIAQIMIFLLGINGVRFSANNNFVAQPILTTTFELVQIRINRGGNQSVFIIYLNGII